jgi:hypothetical protein
MSEIKTIHISLPHGYGGMFIIKQTGDLADVRIVPEYTKPKDRDYDIVIYHMSQGKIEVPDDEYIANINQLRKNHPKSHLIIDSRGYQYCEKIRSLFDAEMDMRFSGSFVRVLRELEYIEKEKETELLGEDEDLSKI